jgi:hypothetical protein
MSRLMVLLALIFALIPLIPLAAAAQAPRRLALPSPHPSGDPVVDRIQLAWYSARGAAGPAPAVLLLHGLGDGRNEIMHSFARYLSARGVGGLVMAFPHHGPRFPRGGNALRHYLSTDVVRVEQVYRQSAADARAALDWLLNQPEVDRQRVGLVGVSLGAIVTHVVMGQDARVNGGVAILGGGNLPDLYRRSILFRLVHPRATRPLTADEMDRLRPLDPLTYAGRNRPRNVLMIQAARDLIIPPADATTLWEALGRPPIRWLDTNHFGPVLALRPIMDASLRYLRSVWAGAPDNAPPLYVPSVKAGLLFGPDSAAEPALTLQLLSLSQWANHTSALHLDAGLTFRGPFAGIALTLNPSLDVGLGRRLLEGGRRLYPYASLHLVF